jgi:trans-2,3-dihydro-3-hydroxyanthranilate isomerase
LAGGLPLYHLDVFAERPYAGNPLAVVLADDGPDPSAGAMQTIARELHLSETVFVLAGGSQGTRLRIFTPATELPFAGHPTVGAAWLLAHLRRVATGSPFGLEVAAGPLEARVEAGEGGGLGAATVRAPDPHPAGADEREPDLTGRVASAVLEAAGLSGSDLAGPPPESWSTGNLHHITLLKPGTDLDAIRPDLRRLAESFPEGGCLLAVVDAPGRARARYFAPAIGVPEDPATGSAAAAFTGFLAARRPEALDDGRVRIEQGAGMGQPSVLHGRWRDGVAEISGTAHLLYQAELPRPEA